MRRAILISLCLSFGQAALAAPCFQERCLYAPAHFGNSYEVMGAHEMRSMLEEARFWGFTAYCDWIDTVDASDPFADPHYNFGKAVWERKKVNFKSAYDLGFDCGLCITPNHVYLDQCDKALLATKDKRIFGQLLCPSKPEARAIILANYRHWFSDLKKAGVVLSSLSPCPYDYGGCACAACAPWILTFAQLCREIHAIAQDFFPAIELHFVGWWWQAEEHRLFAEWCDKEAPGWAKSINLHIPYGQTRVGDVALPEGCERRAFIHIGYADQAKPRDCYGHLGPVVAATRLETTLKTLASQGVTGFMAYSEGVYEDLNKALLAGLSSGAYADADSVIEAYAQRYFKVDAPGAAAWCAWLKAWGRPFEIDAATALAIFNTLPKAETAAGNWRMLHWKIKAQLLALNQQLVPGSTWTPDRIAQAESFWALRETLERQVYGLGPLRHILDKHFAALPWQASWAAHCAAELNALDAAM